MNEAIDRERLRINHLLREVRSLSHEGLMHRYRKVVEHYSIARYRMQHDDKAILNMKLLEDELVQRLHGIILPLPQLEVEE